MTDSKRRLAWRAHQRHVLLRVKLPAKDCGQQTFRRLFAFPNQSTSLFQKGVKEMKQYHILPITQFTKLSHLIIILARSPILGAINLSHISPQFSTLNSVLTNFIAACQCNANCQAPRSLLTALSSFYCRLRFVLLKSTDISLLSSYTGCFKLVTNLTSPVHSTSLSFKPLKTSLVLQISLRRYLAMFSKLSALSSNS